MVAVVPILNHTRHAFVHKAMSSSPPSLPVLLSVSPQPTVPFCWPSSEWRKIVSSPGASTPAFLVPYTSFHSSDLVSPESLLIWRISWKLLSAARETSALRQRAADSMNSSRRAQALGKSPATTTTTFKTFTSLRAGTVSECEYFLALFLVWCECF